MGTPVDMLLRIIGGHTVPPPIVALDGEQTVLGFGRFVSRLAPSPAERAAAQALLKQLPFLRRLPHPQRLSSAYP